MKKLGHVLPQAMGQGEVLRTARAQRTLKHWDEVVGEFLGSRSHPDRYGKGTVWIAVQGSAWASELRMRKDSILARLREISGEPDLFLDLRFGVRPFEKDAPLQPPPPVEREEHADLSIREIAERRLANWPSDEAPDAEGA